MDKPIFVNDIAVYSAAGSSPLAVYAAVETVITSPIEGCIGIPELSPELDRLTRYQKMLEQSVLRLLQKHDVETIYLQAPEEGDDLLKTLRPEKNIVFGEADLNATELPCIVAAIDKTEKGEAAVALFVTHDAENAKAQLIQKPFEKDTKTDGIIFSDEPTAAQQREWYGFCEEHNVTAKTNYLYPALNALGNTSHLMAIAYAIGNFNYSFDATKQLHYLTKENNDEQYISLEVSAV